MSYRSPPPGEVPNYTNAFLGMALLILFMGFWVIAALWGYLWVGLTALALDRGIGRIGRG